MMRGPLPDTPIYPANHPDRPMCPANQVAPAGQERRIIIKKDNRQEAATKKETAKQLPESDR